MTIKQKTCPKCGTENKADSRFCKTCGSTLAVECPHCHSLQPSDSQFCAFCGASFSAPPKDIPPAPDSENQRAQPSRVYVNEQKTVADIQSDERAGPDLKTSAEPMGKEVSPRGRLFWFLPFYTIPIILGYWGGSHRWGGETDAVPFIFLLVILPIYSIVVGALVRHPTLCALVSAGFGFAMGGISHALFQGPDDLLAAFICAGEGAILSSITALIARRSVRKRLEHKEQAVSPVRAKVADAQKSLQGGQLSETIDYHSFKKSRQSRKRSLRKTLVIVICTLIPILAAGYLLIRDKRPEYKYIQVPASNNPEAMIGKPLWERTFGGNGRDEGDSFRKTTDGGFILTGAVDFHSVLVKTDQNGRSLWEKTYRKGWGYDVDQSSDGGFILVGFTTVNVYADVYVAKTDKQGRLAWERTIGGKDEDRGKSIRSTEDGGYIIAGYTASKGAGYFDVYLVKLDEEGKVTWDRTFGGGSLDEGNCVQQTADGGFVITGYKGQNKGPNRVYLIKTDKTGRLLWEKTFEAGVGNWVEQTVDGGYIVAGTGRSPGGRGTGMLLLKVDEEGNLEWKQSYGQYAEDLVTKISVGNLVRTGGCGANCVQESPDGGYLMVGYTSTQGSGDRDVFLVKTNGIGSAEWARTFGGKNEDWGNTVYHLNSNDYVVAGYTQSFGSGGSDMYLLKWRDDR